MMIKFGRFNGYFAVLVGLVLLAGCETTNPKDKHAKEASKLALFLEANPDGSDRVQQVPIFREKPTYITVDKEPIVDETDVDQAVVMDDLGGFVVRVRFNWHATQLLEGATGSNSGRRIAVFGSFEKEARWLAAPMIRRRISDGVFTFTPDCSREEADRLVRGLNNLARLIKKKDE